MTDNSLSAGFFLYFYGLLTAENRDIFSIATAS